MDAADELDRVSKALVETERQLAPEEADLTTFIEDFIVGLWAAHIDRGEKHPPEKTRGARTSRVRSRPLPQDPHPARITRAREGSPLRSPGDRRRAKVHRLGGEDGGRSDGRPAAAVVWGPLLSPWPSYLPNVSAGPAAT
jgi:hypothetical protein